MSQRKDNRFASRPRSLTTHYGSSPSVLGSVLGGQYNSYLNGYSKSFSPSSYRNYSPYSSSLGRASSNLGIYGGTSSGYGGVYIPGQSTLSSLNLMSPTLKNLDKRILASQKNFKKTPLASQPAPQPKALSQAASSKERKSRAPSRSHSFNKDRSQSLTSLDNGGLSSRSVSLTSLVSDGYCSGSERTSDAGEAPSPVKETPRPESNREPDYRALWEASQKEVLRLRDLLSTSERQLRESRGTIARLTQVNQNSLTELEKREKRAMERKLSEMEEELKQLQKLKAENERLRAENRALTRVVSKLTNSAGK